MTSERSILDAIYDNEAQRARQVFLTQPVGGGKVIDCTWAQQDPGAFGTLGVGAGWTQIAREQVKMLKDDVGTVLARIDYHQVAAGFGAHGIVVKTMGELDAALAEAKEAAAKGKPVLVNVWLDKTQFREGSLSM